MTKTHLKRFCAICPPISATSDRSVDCRTPVRARMDGNIADLIRSRRTVIDGRHQHDVPIRQRLESDDLQPFPPHSSPQWCRRRWADADRAPRAFPLPAGTASSPGRERRSIRPRQVSHREHLAGGCRSRSAGLLRRARSAEHKEETTPVRQDYEMSSHTHLAPPIVAVRLLASSSRQPCSPFRMEWHSSKSPFSSRRSSPVTPRIDRNLRDEAKLE